MHFGMKLYNDQRNAQVFNLSIYFCLTCFGLSFSPSSEAGVQFRQWFKSPGYGVSALALVDSRNKLKINSASGWFSLQRLYTCSLYPFQQGRGNSEILPRDPDLNRSPLR
jgi:hypothetical protein